MAKSIDTELVKQAKAELKKIKRRVRDIRKRGYSVPDSMIPKLPKLENIGLQTLRHFSKYTTQYIYEHSVYVSPEGVTIKGTERRTQERSEAAKKAADTRRDEFFNSSSANPSWEPVEEEETIIMYLLQEFESWSAPDYWSPELGEYKTRDKDKAYGVLTGAINELGASIVARNARDNATRVNELVSKILYESGNEYRFDSKTGQIDHAINELNELLRGRPLTVKESMILSSEGEVLERHELV